MKVGFVTAPFRLAPYFRTYIYIEGVEDIFRFEYREIEFTFYLSDFAHTSINLFKLFL